MGWIISIVLIVIGGIYKNDMAFIAAGLFAISGSLSIWLNQISLSIKRKPEQHTKDEKSE